MSEYLAAAGIGTSLLGTLVGLKNANTAARTSQQQNDLALRNFYQQQRLAKLQEEMAKAGSTDARGNRTEYVPGVGWITRTTDGTRDLLNASDNEERQRLSTDAIRSRTRRGSTFTRQLNEGALAEAELAQINEGRETPADLRATLTERNVARAVSGADDMRKRIGLNALRTGTGGEVALATLGRNAMADTRTAIAEANVDAPQMYSERRAARVNPRLNAYNMFAGRASAPDDTPFAPNNLDEGLMATLRARANTAPQALGSAMGVDAPRLTNVEDRTAVALGGLGSSLMGAGNYLDKRRARQDETSYIPLPTNRGADGWQSQYD